MDLKGFERILVLAPHTDDGELGLGATIARLIEHNLEVYYHAFSNAADSLPSDLPPDILEKELRKATEILGISQSQVCIHPYKVRTFSYHRQEILERLIALKRDLQPDLVFLPSSQDIHQDHQVIFQEGIRVFKTTCLMGYELPWNNISFPTHCFVVLTKEHVERKVEALACYKSQRHRAYLSPQFIKALATTRGTQIQVPFAEAFEIIRWIIE